MNLPIFVVNTDGSGVAVFADAQRAEANLEAIDVLDGEYDVFDAVGNRLRATASSDDSPVFIVEAPDEEAQPEELRRILRDDLRSLQSRRPELLDISGDVLAEAGLADLVREMQLVEERFRRRSLVSRIQRRVAAIRGRLSGG